MAREIKKVKEIKGSEKCPECLGIMEKKGYIPGETCESGCCGGSENIWQCFSCKNIEIK